MPNPTLVVKEGKEDILISMTRGLEQARDQMWMRSPMGRQLEGWKIGLVIGGDGIYDGIHSSWSWRD